MDRRETMRYIIALLLSIVATCHADCCWDKTAGLISGKEVFARQKNPIWKGVLGAHCNCLELVNEPKENCLYGVCEANGNKCVDGSYSSPIFRYTAENCRTKDFETLQFCEEGKPRGLGYCEAGTCNTFGCRCKECGTPKRKLMQVETGMSPSDSPRSFKSNVVEDCQDQMYKKYNTSYLREPEQIQSYFNCLDSDGSGTLDEMDMKMEDPFLDTSFMKRLDEDRSGSIDPSEFDPELTDSTELPATTSGASVAAFLRLIGAFVVVSSVMVFM